MYPGAAFFQIQNGKIRGVRLYMARDELMEVFRARTAPSVVF